MLKDDILQPLLLLAWLLQTLASVGHPTFEFIYIKMHPAARLTLKGPPPNEQEAATRVQARWRGVMLRRARPLEKLQAIYQVRQDLKAHLQVLAGSTAQFEKLCSDAKERMRWGECAMALLLRLDAVQGAPGDVREVRKLVTREVIAFQEIIDSTSKDASSDVIRRALKSTLTTFL